MSLLLRITQAVFVLVLALPSFGQTQNTVSAEEVAKLREQIAAQQKQLNEQRQALEAAQKTLDEQQKLLDRLTAQTAPAATPAPAPTAVPAPAARQPVTVANVDPKGRALSPLAFHIGGADFTPGGFMDFSNVWRSTNVGTGIATSYGSIPLSNTAAGRTSEFRSSAQNSRITLKVTANPTKDITVTGWIEGDFWGTQPGGAYITSNSNTLRMRQFWANVQKGKWEVLGGQAWHLLTPNRVGVSPMPADLFIGLGQDSNYQVGLTWGRSGQLRVVYHPNSKWSIAASIDNPEQYVTAATTLPAFAASQVSNGSAATTPNVRPDFLAKAAYDTKVGNRGLHLELGGVWRGFRTSPAAGTTYYGQGFGGAFNGNIELVKNFRFLWTSFYSSGGGRYILGLGPDFMVGPNGSISPVHSMSGIGGFEYQASQNSQFFAYYGGMYFRRNYTVTGPGSYLGFGFPGSSTGANRQIQEPTFGYIHTYWRNPNYGALQMITQYSYLTRALWYAAPGTPSTAHVHMLFGALRFTLP